MGTLSDIVGGLTGSTQAGAARAGGRKLSQAALDAADLRAGGADIQAQGGRDAFAFLQEQLDPFASSFGKRDIRGLNALATDPNAQVDFLSNNPLFEALKNQSREATFRTQSAGGQLGSSGTDEMLQNAFLSQGNDLINQQINRQLPLFQAAQNASTNLGTSGANLQTQIANALAQGQGYLASGLEDSAQALVSGSIGSANAKAGGVSNILGGIGSMFKGGGKDGNAPSIAANIAGVLGFSDSRLKENIVKTGEHKGLDTYSWTWNSEAKELGLSGESHGHIAQEVQAMYPELVNEHNGYLMVNYGTDKTVNV